MGAGPSNLRHGLLALAALVSAVAASPAEAARLLTVKGAEATGYGRLTLTFDVPVQVKAKLAGSVLVLSYAERAPGGVERIAAELPSYVTMVRRDPDGTGLRLALVRPLRVNVQEAGESVFIDLLSEAWSGLPPPLPADAVAELARRARAAEALLRARTPAPVYRPLTVEVAHLPTLTRLSMRLPPGTREAVERAGAATRIRIPGTWRIDLSETRGRTRPAIASVTTDSDEEAASLTITPGEGYGITTERDEDGLSIDVALPQAQRPAPAADAVQAPPEPVPARPAVAAEPARAVPVAEPAPERANVAAASRSAGTGLVFAFERPTPAALFQRAGVATLIFETSGPVAPRQPPRGDQPAIGEARRTGPVAVLQFPVPKNQLVDLLPVGPVAAPTAWELTLGDASSASETLVATRLGEAGGRTAVRVRLPEPGAATWLDLDGERVAVVTSLGQAVSLPKPQRFVDFELLPSRRGLAVLAQADDLTVRPELDGVAIGREAGLAVSAVAKTPDVPLAEAGDLAIDRELWSQAQRGDILATLRAQFGAASETAVSARGPLRLVYARTLIANGLEPEALAVLSAIAADDPVLGGSRAVAILRGLANARLGRDVEAKRFLDTPRLMRDAEAALWRAYADTVAGRWLPAEAGFRASLPVLDRYPEDLQAMLRTAAAEAAVETGEYEAAGRQITLALALPLDRLTRDRLAYLRARIEEGTGRAVAAREAYERLAQEAAQPVAVPAETRAVLLAHAAGKLDLSEAIERLERLGITWHGGETESGITAGRFRLYAEAKRWRDAFAAARRTNMQAPDSPLARSLHGEAQILFDDLYLTDRFEALSGIEAVALYFDFKEFAPIGRRGDEVVRRLADRLVALDLLDSAAELLQYQVENRLAGVAKAGVATRLASIRLMDGKPLQAVEALDASYLPELPADLRRARGLIRARALSDLSRTDLALETIEGDTAPDAQRLRADILWGARRWREAGEAHEMLLGEVWRGRQPLDETARADVIRAGIAYVLSGEALGLERLKAKFATPMSESADARTFALLTAPNAQRAPGFREIAQRATSAETLAAFLAEYRRRYPESAVPERGNAARESRAAGAAAPG
ncbi:hypothetical protein [Methylobacterium sp. A54F]